MKKYLVIILNGRENHQIVPIKANSPEHAREIAEKLPYCLRVEEIYEKVQ